MSDYPNEPPTEPPYEPVYEPVYEPATVPALPPQRTIRWPADYYSSATPDPVLPRWASYGCGALAVVVLLVVFIGGAYLSGGGFAQLLDLSLGMTLGDMRGMYTTEVTQAQKETLEKEIESMRAGLRANKIPTGKLQPVLRLIQKSVADRKLTPSEVDQLTAAVRKTAPQSR